MRFNIVTAVWGPRVDFFLELGLPAQMTSGNLLGFSRHDVVYDLYTVAADAPRLQQSEAIRALNAFIPVRFNVLDGQVTGDKHAAMNSFHRSAVAFAAERDAGIIFATPDAFFSDGAMATARVAAENGARAVLGFGMRGGDDLLAEMRPRFNPQGRLAMGVSGRELVDLAVRFPHPLDVHFVWGAPSLSDWPSYLKFPVGDEGWILHVFHFHPVLLYPTKRDALPAVTLDYGFVQDAVPDPAQWVVVNDSDQVYGLDAAPGVWNIGATPRDDAELYVAQWAMHHTTPMERAMFRIPIRVHRGPLGPAWDEAAAKSQAVADRILSRIP